MLPWKNVGIGNKSHLKRALAITYCAVIDIYTLRSALPRRTFGLFGLAEHRWVSQEWQPQQIFKAITCFDCKAGRFIPCMQPQTAWVLCSPPTPVTSNDRGF
jgi:hypothetical protein